MSLKIAVVYGSVRENRAGIRAARFVVRKLREKNHEATLVDPMLPEFSLPFLNKMYKEFEAGKAPENLEKLHVLFREADAILIVTAEYNHSAPPALLNILDHFQQEFYYKPSGIVCYSAGPFGGVRAGMQWRATLGELGMSSIPSIFAISKIQDSFDEEGKAIDETYDRRIEKFLSELEWYANALKAGREQGTLQ
jgi:NAD(P)H-dependent FMN reductase